MKLATFTGRVIIITGASEGIGRALCLALAPQRPKLVLAARNAERLNSAAEESRLHGAETLVVPTDVTDPHACENLIKQALAAYRQIDVLVNNAGATMWARLDEVTDLAVFEQVMRLNYLGSVYCTYHALPHLKKTRGRIVAVSSLAGLYGVPTRTGYAASKHALFGFFNSLRVELKGTGVSITMIAPDFVVSEIHGRALRGDGRAVENHPTRPGNIMSAEACAALMLDGMEKRKRLVLTSMRGKVARWMQLLAPSLVDAMTRRAVASWRDAP